MKPSSKQSCEPSNGAVAPLPFRNPVSRRSFLQLVGVGAAAVGFQNTAASAEKAKAKKKVIQGFEEGPAATDVSKDWKPVSDRKIPLGIAGFGVCKFGAAFGFDRHPNVEIVAVTDIIPDRCAALAQKVKCSKTYPSAEEMVKDDAIEAVFIATDAPSHARLCVEALRRGKHTASAVPAVFGSLEEADQLFEAVKKSGRNYMMFETSYFHDDLHAMREIYRAGGFGKLLYAEGEYFHYMPEPLDSYNAWRTGLPPLPPGVSPGGHGGSHGYLTNEFVLSILENRKPLVDIAQALNMTVAGIVSHQSALKDGELLKIPQYKL